MNNNKVYEWILHSTFTVSAREKNLKCLIPFLSPLVNQGDEILDLCCGSGPMSFWFEEQGAEVTGVDFAAYMLALARDEAQRRNSTVQFVEADIFNFDFGRECYDLISCFGNSISDFPLSDFSRLVKPVTQALNPGGRFVLDYQDGVHHHLNDTARKEGTYQEKPEWITFRFEKYQPEVGALVTTIRNVTRGEAYQRKSYVYTVPVVQLVIGGALKMERHLILTENHFLDIFKKI